MKVEKNKPIRILNILPNMRSAGIETFVMNIYRNIDRKKFQFDFIVHNKDKEFYDDEILSLGGKIYRFSLKDDKNIIKYIRDLNNFFNQHNEYQIIHGHMQSMMPLYLKIAKEHNVKIRIAHSHNNSYERSMKGFILHILSRFTKAYSNINLACSESAGKYLFGNNEFEVVNNGIDIYKFRFNNDVREKVRKKYNIQDDEILIGNIGRMEKQKNQLFLVDLFYDLYKKNNKMKMIIIGEGKLKNKILNKIKKYRLQKNVILIERTRNVNEFMSAFDIFALPSLYEGLGIVLIEAQVAGLKCITTEKTVAKETNITKNIKYLPLNKKKWMEEIEDIDTNYNHLIDLDDKILSFDIKNVAKKMQKIYSTSLGEKND